MTFLSFANGWKTYVVCAAGLITGIIQGLEATHVVAFHIPAAVDWVLVFLGGATLRHGVQTRSAQITEELVDLVEMLLANVTTKAPLAAGAVVHTGDGATINVGQPSPVGQTEAQEQAQTAALNTAQLG